MPEWRTQVGCSTRLGVEIIRCRKRSTRHDSETAERIRPLALGCISARSRALQSKRELTRPYLLVSEIAVPRTRNIAAHKPGSNRLVHTTRQQLRNSEQHLSSSP